jgi:serine/threonine protein kinase
LRTECKSHKNLSLFHDDFFIIDSHLFFLADFEPNGSLEQRIVERQQQQQGFSEFFILKIQVQICDALNYLHAKHFIHGNLKPENVLLTLSDEVKLTDFGFYHVACRQSEDSIKCPEFKLDNPNHHHHHHRHQQASTTTALNAMYGLTYKSDINMFGLVLFKMVTLTEYESPLEHLKSQYEYSERLQMCITNMLHEEPDNRLDLTSLMANLKTMLGETYYFLLTKIPKLLRLEGKVGNLMSVDELSFDEKKHGDENNLNYFFMSSFGKVRMQNKNGVKLKEVSARYVYFFKP